jgi:hypothetical protein
MQSFPVTVEMSLGVPACSFATGKSSSSRAALCGMAGNSMHVAVVGGVLEWALFATRRSILSIYRTSRRSLKITSSLSSDGGGSDDETTEKSNTHPSPSANAVSSKRRRLR